MIPVDFLATVVLVSTSGVLSPGPLFLASTLRATRLGGLAGIECAVGHTIVEFPLVVGLSLGLAALLSPLTVRIIGVVGGLVLFAFASLQLLQAVSKIELSSESISRTWDRKSGILVGLAFTALNPFFVLWWLTVGSVLVLHGVLLGALGGVVLMYAAHVWMDYVWLGGTAALAGRGRLFLGRWYRILLIIFGVAMGYFGVAFILSAVL